MAKKEKGWPKKLDKGRFTTYCKEQGFKGPCEECAKKALKSKDPSVRGEASFYLNTVKKKASVADYVRFLGLRVEAVDEDIKIEDVPEEFRAYLKKIKVDDEKVKSVRKKNDNSYIFMLGPSIITFDQDKYMVSVGGHQNMTVVVTKR